MRSLSSVLKRFKICQLQHRRGRIATSIPTVSKTDCQALNFFNLLYIALCVRVPYYGGILQDGLTIVFYALNFKELGALANRCFRNPSFLRAEEHVFTIWIVLLTLEVIVTPKYLYSSTCLICDSSTIFEMKLVDFVDDTQMSSFFYINYHVPLRTPSFQVTDVLFKTS